MQVKYNYPLLLVPDQNSGNFIAQGKFHAMCRTYGAQSHKPFTNTSGFAVARLQWTSTPARENRAHRGPRG
jgi:hypothetical protein